jgi:Methyltransferase domain
MPESHAPVQSSRPGMVFDATARPVSHHASNYYQYLPRPGSLPARMSTLQRTRMFEHFLDASGAVADDRVLDLGVTNNEGYALDNYLEALYPWKNRITAAGLEDGAHLELRYPGVNFVHLEPGPLPFADRAFDITHSSAVIEHVGSRAAQTEFLREMWRLTRRTLFVTTPNRWFPVEFHTVLPLLHWLPPALFRAALLRFGKNFYAEEENLNLMSGRELRRIATAAGLDEIVIGTVALFGWPTNLLLIARRTAR